MYYIKNAYIQVFKWKRNSTEVDQRGFFPLRMLSVTGQ